MALAGISVYLYNGQSTDLEIKVVTAWCRGRSQVEQIKELFLPEKRDSELSSEVKSVIEG